jgi:hypothetical protein
MYLNVKKKYGIKLLMINNKINVIKFNIYIFLILIDYYYNTYTTVIKFMNFKSYI